jgi:hypothetical protein
MRERDYLEDTDVDRMIILKWIIKMWDREAWSGLICFRIGAVDGHL